MKIHIVGAARYRFENIAGFCEVVHKSEAVQGMLAPRNIFARLAATVYGC
jgi:hypothetical protein